MTNGQQSFKLLIMGDSVLWGQGLYEYQKIHTLMVEALRHNLKGMAVTATLLAHSGAIIGEPDDKTTEPPLKGDYANEVPVGNPTVFQQIDAALAGQAQDRTVNAVILNGGINDLDVTTIVNPFAPFLDRRLKNCFYDRLKPLIERVYHAFPEAVVIVVGYYLFFSSESEKAVVLSVLKAMGVNLNVPGLSTSINAYLLDWFARERIINRFTYVHDEANALMRQAIVDTVTLLPEASSRVYFCDPKFRPEHAIGASQSLLYGIAPDLSPQDPDEIASGRARACAENADRLSLVRQVACPRASAAHPNPAGAQHYAEAILTDLRYALPALFVS
ncbi:MAG: hypothetical protein R3E39_16400 [Anaerolineae bacterium]